MGYYVNRHICQNVLGWDREKCFSVKYAKGALKIASNTRIIQPRTNFSICIFKMSLATKQKRKHIKPKGQKVKLFRANDPLVSVLMWGVNHSVSTGFNCTLAVTIPWSHQSSCPSVFSVCYTRCCCGLTYVWTCSFRTLPTSPSTPCRFAPVFILG